MGHKGSVASPIQVAALDSVECAIVLQGQKDKFELFDETLRRADFWFALEQACFKVGAEAAAFRILIKPDVTACEATVALATDPQLVEHLIDLLQDRGFTQVVVAESRNSFDICLENRDVQILADMLGYQYVTPKGRDYDVIDLGEELQEVSVAEGSVLHGVSLSRHWQDADFRILFAKNRTDEINAYSLCAESLISILPLRDKVYHYKHRLKPENVLVELIRETRVDFCIVDAYISSHGNAGSRCSRPIETNTFIAGHNLLLTDFAAAKKMGLDPYDSPLNAKALQDVGLPEPRRIEGDLTPYSEWVNVHPLMLDSARRREHWPEVSQLLVPWLQTVDQQLFPFKDPLNGQINLLLSRYFSRVDDNPTIFWTVVAINYLIALVYQLIETYQILYSKDRLWQKEVPLNIDLHSYPLDDYETIVDYLEPLEKRALQVSLRPRERFWDIPVPKIDSAFDSLFVPRPSR
ncbi:MAG: DUF362 domain-containing protein, partial [gamma proteobacterium endosymbiont of Lamellibrachia anaximandri]|nr:DUF362 domain-containing protein [gamma proteobacterium endosymbiont of Lamellibrachia anaximandri]